MCYSVSPECHCECTHYLVSCTVQKQVKEYVCVHLVMFLTPLMYLGLEQIMLIIFSCVCDVLCTEHTATFCWNSTWKYLSTLCCINLVRIIIE